MNVMGSSKCISITHKLPVKQLNLMVLRKREGEKINAAAFSSNAAFQLEEVYLKSSSCLATSAV